MKKQNTYMILLVAVLAFVSVFVYMQKVDNKLTSKKDKKEIKETKETDATKFKKEYESLNNKVDEDNKTYKKISIEEENPMVYSSAEEIVKRLQEGTSIIYLGFPECPWCRNAVPVLLESAKEEGVDKIYYFNALSIRDQKHVENGKIVTDKEGTSLYYEIVDHLKDFLPSYKDLGDDSIKRLYFPTVVFVKEGKIQKVHTSTVDSQKDPSKSLTQEQKEELKGIYSKEIQEMSAALCDEKC
ncbi:MAG: hypothetical protein PHN72_05635 [Bacilli bacterium]|nr:hypothetical protein [Bacilli bacterium]